MTVRLGLFCIGPWVSAQVLLALGVFSKLRPRLATATARQLIPVGRVQSTTHLPTTSGRAVAALLIGSGSTVESLQKLDRILFKAKAAEWCEFLGITSFEVLT